MKKKSVCLCLSLLLSALTVCGCRYRGEARAEVESEIAALREENIARAESLEAEASPEEPTAGSSEISAEAEPVKATSKRDWDGITSSQYTLIGDRYYYYVKARKALPAEGGGTHTHTTGVLAYVYTDLTQGGMQYVCPDPLCKHSDPSVCPFTASGQSASFCPAEDGFFYLAQYARGRGKIVKADLNKGTIQTVYEGRSTFVGFYGAENGVVYIRDSEDVTDNNTKTTQTTNYLLALDVKTDKVLFEQKIPDGNWIVSVRDGKILCHTVRALLEYDMQFGNQKTLFSFEGTGGFGEWYYDENRDEFWFNVRNRDESSGQVFRILADGTAEKVPLPTDAIYCFQLTNTKIYYSPFDPVKIDDNPTYPPGTVDYTNGKIYAVDRDDPGGEPTLVYDCAGRYYIGEPSSSDYAIFGDDLFFGKLLLRLYKDYFTGEEYFVFDMSGDYPKVHVNLATGEEEIFQFD